MPVIRLRRPEAPETASDPEDKHARAAVELEGFESESADSQAQPSKNRHGGSRWLTGVLAALVLLEAVPTALWARNYLGPVAAALPAPTASAAADVAQSTLLVASIAPCEASPSAEAATGPGAAPAAVAISGSEAVPTAPTAAQPIAAGLLAVASPLPLHVYSRGRLIGTSEADSVMLPLGSHELEFVNEMVGFRVTRAVTIQAGRRASLRIDPPTGTLHINAAPWADVWIDNERVGQTPIGNLSIAVGNRDVLFRHPELGERRLRVLVTLKEPARISMDLRKP